MVSCSHESEVVRLTLCLSLGTLLCPKISWDFMSKLIDEKVCLESDSHSNLVVVSTKISSRIRPDFDKIFNIYLVFYLTNLE